MKLRTTLQSNKWSKAILKNKQAINEATTQSKCKESNKEHQTKVLKDKKANKEEINLHKPKLEWKEQKECKDTRLECK